MSDEDLTPEQINAMSETEFAAYIRRSRGDYDESPPAAAEEQSEEEASEPSPTGGEQDDDSTDAPDWGAMSDAEFAEHLAQRDLEVRDLEPEPSVLDAEMERALLENREPDLESVFEDAQERLAEEERARQLREFTDDLRADLEAAGYDTENRVWRQRQPETPAEEQEQAYNAERDSVFAKMSDAQFAAFIDKKPLFEKGITQEEAGEIAQYLGGEE